MKSLDLEKELCFYKKYHCHPTNVLIHITCIPMILATYLVAASYIELIPSKYKELVSIHPYINLGTIAAIYYAIFYIRLDNLGYPVGLIIISFALFTKHFILSNLNYSKEIMIATGLVNVFSWIAQFIGHGVFEGKKPALLDNLTQALLLAPFFVVFELVFALGYRKDLEISMNNNVAKTLSQERKNK